MRDPDGVGVGEYKECMDLVRFHLRVQVEAPVGGLPDARRHAAEVAVLGLRAAARDALDRSRTRSEPNV
jgi:hypothetical protein